MPVHLEIKCPKCGKQFKSEEEMLEHYENCFGAAKKKRSPKKAVLAVAIIAILVLSSFAFLNYWSGAQPSKTTDGDGDGIIDWDEVNVYNTDSHTADTDGGGVNDFHEIFTYGLNPNDPQDDHELIAKLPNVTANLWIPKKIGLLSAENYVNLSLTDPLIQYLAKRSVIIWADNKENSGTLLIDGSPAASGRPSNTEVASQPSYYFTHDRQGNCVESTLANLAILRLMGYRAIEVGGRLSTEDIYGHDWSEVLISGKVFVVNYNNIFERPLNSASFLIGTTTWTPNSDYDPDWYLK